MRSTPTHSRTYPREELYNALTHGVGAVVSLAAGAILITMASLLGSVWQIVGACVFAGSMLLLYSASTVYHGVTRLRLKARLRVLDHSAIFILIAGSYPPFMLVGLRGGWGWSLFGVVWTLAVVGIILKLFLTGQFNRTSTAIYLSMGWLAIVAIIPLAQALDPFTFFWLVAGGLLYTAGTYFFISERIPYGHTIWHLFVLGGSMCHFVAAFAHLAPLG